MNNKNIIIHIREDLQEAAKKHHIDLDDITFQNYICAYFQQENAYGQITMEQIKKEHTVAELEQAVNYMLEREISCRK